MTTLFQPILGYADKGIRRQGPPHDDNRINTQPIQKRVRRFGWKGEYAVADLFRTIQGEGPLAGTPSYFLRLAGCNLQCRHCDTDYRVRYNRSAAQIVQAVEEDRVSRGSGATLVVITGGEPFRQPLSPLLDKLMAARLSVQVETNGTYCPNYVDNFLNPYHRNFTVVVSPKTGKVAEGWNERWFDHPDAIFWKFVIDPEHVDKHGLPTRVLGMSIAPARPPMLEGSRIWVQPEDIPGATRDIDSDAGRVAEIAFRHGYQFMPQVHKLIGLP